MGAQHHDGSAARATGRPRFADDPRAACMRLAADAACEVLRHGSRHQAALTWRRVADLWFAGEQDTDGWRSGSEQAEWAKAVCWTCPLREDCLGHALAVGEVYGIWGGLDWAQRRALVGRPLRARRTA
jgi:hypothetical protein